MRKRIAIIGAGISGLTLAHHLSDRADVVVYEKARGVGGRMSTRYADPYYFDHGTQYFTARTIAFKRFLAPFFDSGTIAQWCGKVITLEVGKKTSKRLWIEPHLGFEPHLVATPHMNSLCKQLAVGIDVKLAVEITPLANKTSTGWQLYDKVGNDLGNYHWVISTAPPAQTLALFQTALTDHSPIHVARMQACFALLLGFKKRWDKQWIAAKVNDNPIQWISINSTKPARGNPVTSIVVHSRHDWAERHLEDDMFETQKILVNQFEAATGIGCAQADYLSMHRWKYAVVEETKSADFYLDLEQGIAASSDWSSTSRIEEVWSSAVRLANEINRLLR